jgi:hypothetical protein
MAKRTLLIACCLGLLFVAVVAISTMTETPRVIVYITEDGFSPKEIAVRKGTEVAFVNMLERQSWPAGDPHPVHDLYSQSPCPDANVFDACRGLLTRESWDFVFKQVGEWSYHDHFAPEVRGSIIVRTLPAFVLDAAVSFFSGGDTTPHAETRTPAKAHFRNMDINAQFETIERMGATSPDEAWSYLRSIAFENGVQVVSPNHIPTHDLAHVVGKAMYDRYGTDGVARCTADFNYACFHAAVGQAFIESGVGSVPMILGACDTQPEDEYGTPFIYNCIHGIGHGIATAEALDVDRSLGACDALFDDERERRHCYSGVFMEYFHSAPISAFDEENIWEVCAIWDPKYHEACGYRLPDLTHDRFLRAPSEVLAICLSGPTEILRTSCVEKAARIVSAEVLGDSDRVLDICNEIAEPYRDLCLMHAGMENVRAHFKNGQDHARILCENILDETLRRACEISVQTKSPE